MRYQCRVIIYSLTEGNNNIDTLSNDYIKYVKTDDDMMLNYNKLTL